jgi:hypothetical protein
MTLSTGTVLKVSSLCNYSVALSVETDLIMELKQMLSRLASILM